MFIFFYTFFLSVLLEAKAEESFNQHSSLEIIPKDICCMIKTIFTLV